MQDLPAQGGIHSGGINQVTTEELQEQSKAASRTLNNLYADRDAEIRRRYQKIRQQVEAEYEERIDAAKAAHREAQAAVDAAKVAAAQTQTQLPVGTRVAQWNWHTSIGGHRRGQAFIVGHGVIEVWTRESLRSAGIPSYNIPDPGTLVVRHLKNNGRPSTKFTRLNHAWLPNGWYLEGVNPNEMES